MSEKARIQANSADPDQMPHNVASDQGLHCLLTGFSIKNRNKATKLTQRPFTRKFSIFSCLLFIFMISIIHFFISNILFCNIKNQFWISKFIFGSSIFEIWIAKKELWLLVNF